MEDNLSEGGKSSPHDFTDQDLKRSGSSLKTKISEIKDLDSSKHTVSGPLKLSDSGSLKHSVTGSLKHTKSDSLKHSVTGSLNHTVTDSAKRTVTGTSKRTVTGSLKHSDTDSYSSLKKESSSTKENTVKDIDISSILNKPSTLLKKTELESSLKSTTSELLSVNEPVLVKSSTVQSSQSKSQNISVNTSVSQNKSIVTIKTLSEKSEIDNFQYTIPSKQTRSDDVSKISNNKSNLNEIYKETKTPTLLKSSTTEASQKTNERSLNYVSPWAKSLPKRQPKLSQTSTKADEIKEDINIKCIPPWAKTLRKFYEMTCLDPNEDPIPSKNLQEKIKSLMDKHSRLMLVKRGESRKQFIIKPSECGDMGTIKMASKNTRYYMSPISKDVEEPFFGTDLLSSEEKVTANLNQGSDDGMTMTEKKTSRSQAKNEVSNVLKSLYNSKNHREMEKEKLKNQQIKCPKITPSKVRDYVNSQALDSDAQKLHEIIKIKKVPSLGRKPSSKYIINVPKSSKGDGTTVNKITVKEKRKIRINSVEDINENITEIIYNKDSKTQELESGYTAEENVDQDVVPYSKRHKSPMKSRTLQVTAEQTPIISDLLKKEEKNKDKILLIQYEKKSKPCKETSEPEKPTLVSTQLLGIRQPCNETLKEMYLYGTETDGTTCKERITQVDDVSPTLREKVNMIFQELREMTFKPCAELEPTAELHPSDSSKTSLHPSLLVEADTVSASVQALPEVRSAEVQVRDSMLFSQSQSITKHTGKPSLSEKDKEVSISQLENKISDVTDGSFTEFKQKRISRLDSKEQTDVDSKRSTDIKEKEEVPKIDDTIFIEEDEKETSEESKQSKEGSKQTIDGIEMQEKTEAEDRRTEKGIDEGYVKLTQDDQDEISQDEQDFDDMISEEHLTKEKNEALEYDETLLEGEKGSKDSITKDDEHLKEDKDNEEIKGDEEEKDKEEKDEEEKDEEYLVEKDTKEEEKEESQSVMSDQSKAQDGQIHVLMEDIRSYDFDPAQDYELRMISSSKFFHQRNSLRKMHWTEDILYLEKITCPQLIKGLAEIAIRQPEDPISYLAHWIYKDYHNRESDEKNSVFKEHLEVAKGMLNIKKDECPVSKKFNIRRYPMKTHSSVVSVASETSHNTSEETEAEDLYNEN